MKHVAMVCGLLGAWEAEAETWVKAFTKDSSSVLYLSTAADESGTAVVTVVDLHTGATQEFEASFPEDPGAARLNGLSPALDAWLKKHPTVPAAKSRTSPDGKASVEVSAGDAASRGVWEGGSWKAIGEAGWELQVVRDGKRAAAAVCGGGASITAYWSPDGQRTVWVVSHGALTMRDPGYEEVIVGTDGTPSVALLAPNKARLPSAEKLIEGFEKAGFPVVRASAAKKERAESVVFVAATADAERGKRLAAAVPGGATIERLDWPSPHPFVVALGTRALAP